MFVKLPKTAPIIVATVAVAAWASGWGTAAVHAQCGGSCGGSCGHGGHAGHEAGSTGHEHGAARAAHDQPAPTAPHGGQLTKAKPLTFEVVYRPQEVRVYIYGQMPYPASAKEVRGEVLMQVRDNPRVFRFPLSYVAPPAGSSEQDYLAAAVDLTRIRDGDMTVTLNLENLPLPEGPKLTFTQTFAMSRTKPQVAIAVLDESDRAGIARQKVCPITGEPLGKMGDPVKLLIDGQPLYVCCQGCVAKVKNNPAAFLSKAMPQITLATLGEGDRAGVARQRVCPVTGAALGSMGDPIKVLVGGQPLYLCCKGCLGKVQSDPDVYLRKAGHTSQVQ